jgi:hypothetical protein
MGNRDAARDLGVFQDAAAVDECLGPAGGRRVLRADAAAGRQEAGAAAVRTVDHDADVPPARHAFAAHHRRGERLLGRQSEREGERPRTIIRRDRVAPAGELQAEEHLGDVMSARAELVKDFAIRDEPRLLERIERAGYEDRAKNGFPVRHVSSVPVRRADILRGSAGDFSQV